MSEPVSLSQFATMCGWTPSYVTKLKQHGRLVLTEDGQKVDVDASIARIKETEDPNRDDVRKRWKEHRARGDADPGSTPPPTPDPSAASTTGFAQARAVKERYLALSAKLDYERASGKLVETSSVQRAGAEAGTVIRAALENLPDQLAPMLAPITDEEKLRAFLADHVESLLAELAQRIDTIAQRVVDAGGEGGAG